MQTEESLYPTRPEVVNVNSNGHAQKRHNLQLLLASLRNGQQKLREGVTIVFTSPSHKEGVSHVAQLFAVELARYSCRRTLVIDAERLRALRVQDYLRMPQNCHRTNIENLWLLPSKGPRRSSDDEEMDGEGLVPISMPKSGREMGGLDPVDSLRVSFENILIDCRPLKHSSEAAVIASSADGVVMVVEAGRTRREEIVNAQRTIEMAGGNFLGFVMNKRRYPVPEWLYKRL